MSGPGQHARTTGGWVFAAALQFALVRPTAFAVWLATPVTKPGSRQ